MVDVAAEDRRLQRGRLDHVVRHEQELPARAASVVLGDDVDEALLAARVRVAAQDRVQHGHEVALAGAERAVEVRGLRGPALHRGLDHPEGLVEAVRELRGDHVVADRGLLAHALGQGEHEVPGVHPLGDVDEVAQKFSRHESCLATRSSSSYGQRPRFGGPPRRSGRPR